MKNKFYLHFALLVFGLAQTAFGQISKRIDYFGKAGTSDVFLSLSDTGTTLSFAVLSGNQEFGGGTVTATNTGIFTLPSGRQVTFRIVDSSTITGTIAGVAFTATRESDVGPQSAMAGVYQGSIQDRLNVNLRTYFGTLVIYPSGRVLLFVGNTGGDLVGTGSRNAAGVITVTVNTTMTFRFSFSGSTGSVFSPVTTSGFPFSNDFICNFNLERGSSLINVATRGRIAPGQPMTAGFVIAEREKTVLIRAVGPTLSAFGVADANTDPTLKLFFGQTQVANNDNWGENANAAEIPGASTQSGAFSLVAGSKDAVLLVKLKPGAYTAEASSVGNAAGDTLIEVYEISK